MTSLRPRTRRWILRLLSRRRGSVQAIQDVDYFTEVLRFGALFTALLALPIALLAMLALGSLQAEEAAIDAGLQQRAEAIADQVQVGLDQMFTDLEAQLLDRIAAGDVQMAGVSMGGLRMTFRIESGRVVEPFSFPGQVETRPDPTPAFEQAWQQAQRAEVAGDVDGALAAYERALGHATSMHHQAEVRLAHARLRLHNGHPDAVRELVYVKEELPSARERHGVRIDDLSLLLLAEAAAAEGDPAREVALLLRLIERETAAHWYIGLPGEAFAAELALERLEGRYEPRLWSIFRNQLQEKTRRLYWASHVADELRLIANLEIPERSLQILAEERSLWAVVGAEDRLWALSFDEAAVQAELARSVLEVANKVDPDLTASLVRSRDEIGGSLARRSLAPLLPRTAIIVRPTDPPALAAQRARTSTQRRLVILLAVLAAALGIVAAVRTVNHELEGARQKADFAANVSHELRSPLTQIRLKAESLQLDLVFDDADRQAHYDAIVRESERLSRLIDNVLDFSSIERGVKRYTLRPDDLGEVVLKAVDATRDAARAAGVEFVVELPEDLPVVWMDREALGQVVTNLLSNAVKYGAEGGKVEVTVEASEDEVQVEVRDHGIGIAPEDQDRIFEHFYRVASADVRKRRGTGIGLTIVRYIVEAHGGTISVRSHLGQGSSFRVALPTEPPPEARDPRTS